jgi:quercetin dioxygenase-like cupin family protein
MSTKRLGSAIAIAIASITVVVFTSGIGLATDPVNLTSELIAQGQVRFSAELRAVAGTDVVVAKNTSAPGGSSGWHSHPGGVVIVVQTGELTLYKESVGGGSCQVHTYHAGDVFFERRTNMQNGVNTGTTTTVVTATFFNVPHGGSARIDRADPGDCPS